MQSCMQKNEKKHEKWDYGSQVSLGEKCADISVTSHHIIMPLHPNAY